MRKEGVVGRKKNGLIEGRKKGGRNIRQKGEVGRQEGETGPE